MIPWNFYEKRRNIDFPSFIKNNKMQNYKLLEEWCENQKISPPSKKYYEQAKLKAFPPKPKIEKSSPKKEAKKKPATKKRTYKRKAPTKK
tara:strand:+ start:700 stop:969 length:270 start_codon:yes stop_codon:yes gene_type:complete